ncbi:NADH dehydrogenase [Fibrobacterales bacterium]|nr:NADH dehydrogenase [Fibrobacterales bacterium]
MLEIVIFSLFAVIGVAAAFALFISKHPINGAMALVLNMLALAGIYTLLHSTFLGVLQILVYAGAVMMLIVFVIMVLNGARETRLPRLDKLGLCAALAVAAGVALIVGALYGTDLTASETAIDGSVAAVAEHLFDTSSRGAAADGGAATFSGGYFILFEIVGFILLSVMVGAVLVAKRNLANPVENER